MKHSAAQLPVRSFFWSLAWSPLLTWKVGPWAPAGAALAVVGLCIGARRLSGASCWRILGGAACMVLAAIGLGQPGLWTGLGVGLGTALGLHQALVGLGLVASSTLAGLALREWRVAKLGEAFCMAALLGSMLAAHRHGMVHQPAWFSDLLLSRGWNLLDGLRFAGLGGAGLGIVYVLSASLAEGRRLTRSQALLLLAGLWAAWAVSSRVGSPQIHRPPPPPPPLSSDLPPPPPPPDRVALVVFGSWFKPSGPVLFSTTPPESRPGAVGAPPREVESEVHLFEASDRPPALISAAALEKLPARKAFAGRYRIRSVPPGTSPTEILGPEELGAPDWTPEQLAKATEYPPHPELSALAARLAEPEALAGGRIGAIKVWLEKNIPVSEKAAPTEPQPFEAFAAGLLARKPCGMEQLARAAVDLLRRAGIPARLAEGFAYDPGKEFKRELLLTSQHRQHWPEVYLKESGWTPLPLSPEQILDRPEPPPQQDLEDILARMNEEPDAPLPAAASGEQRATRRLALLLAGAGGCLVLLHPLFLFLLPRTSRASLRHELRLLRLAGLARAFGESWEEFAGRISVRSPRCGSALLGTLKVVIQSLDGEGSQVRPVLHAMMVWLLLPKVFVLRLFNSKL